MESAREARRRRILDRGSDRLAFITGQSNAFTDSQSSGTLFSANGSTVLQQSSQQQNDDSLKSTTFSSFETDSISEVPKDSQRDEIVSHGKDDSTLASRVGNEAEMLSQKSYQTSEPVTDSVACRSVNEQLDPTISTTSERLTASADHVDEAIPRKRDVQDKFSAKRINYAISASENIRLLCAVMIAVLVVVANHGYILGGTVASIINFLPIFLVLLTDLTIILGLLMITRETVGKEKERTIIANDVYGWANNLGKIMEIALVLQKVVQAILMDCSICAVLMICGVGI